MSEWAVDHLHGAKRVFVTAEYARMVGLPKDRCPMCLDGDAEVDRLHAMVTDRNDTAGAGGTTIFVGQKPAHKVTVWENIGFGFFLGLSAACLFSAALLSLLLLVK